MAEVPSDIARAAQTGGYHVFFLPAVMNVTASSTRDERGILVCVRKSV